MMLPQNAKIVNAFPNQVGGAIAGDWVCVKDFHRAMLIVGITTAADHTDVTLTVDKATNVAAGNESAGITLDNTWTLVDIPAIPLLDVMTKGAVGAVSVAPAIAANTAHLFVVDINTDELPTNLFNFDCLQATMAGGHATQYVSGVWVLYEPRYAQEPQLAAVTD